MEIQGLIMRFQCPECKAVNKFTAEECGKEAQCKTCGKNITLPATPFAAGSVIGDFAIIREIAKGGMGIVYLAQQLSLDRPAALKIIQPHLCSDKSLVDNLVQEARLAAKLNHPNIVQAYAVGNDDGVIYFAMEYVDGPTMKAVLAEEKVLDFKRAANIASQIADALSFAWNERKLTHRDIKPDNIIIASNGRAKLADLGLSQIGTKSNVTENGEVLGTPQYISPEQLTGSEIDCRSDIYSLGATLFQFVTGRYAYVGENTDEIAKQHVTGNLTPPKEINPDIPGMLNDIIVKMMALSPANRYQNAKEVRIALDKFIAVADTLKAASAAPAAGAAPAISIIKLDTKQSTSEKKNPAAAEESPAADAAPKSAVPKAAPKAAVPKPGAPKAAIPKPGASKAAIPKPGAPKAAIPKAAAPQGDAKPEVAKPESVPVIKGIAPKSLTAPKEEKSKENKPASPVKRLLLLLIAGLIIIAAAGAVLFFLTSPAEEEGDDIPVVVYAQFAVEAKNLAAQAHTLSDAEFLSRCDTYFQRTVIPADAQMHDITHYQNLRNLYAVREEAVRSGSRRAALLDQRVKRAAEIKADAEVAKAAAEEHKRLRDANEKEIAARQREQDKVSSAYMAKVQAEMNEAMGYFFIAIAENDVAGFTEKTKKMALFNPDYTMLSSKDMKKASDLFAQAQKLPTALTENIAAISRFSIAKDYIIGVQFPWQVSSAEGKQVEYLFHVDDFDVQKLYLTDLYTDTRHEIEFANITADSLKGIDAAIDRKALARKSKLENVVFPANHPRQHFLFFYLMNQKQYAPWMRNIAPNDVWVQILDGIIRYKGSN